MLQQSDVLYNDVVCSTESRGNITDKPDKHQATQKHPERKHGWKQSAGLKHMFGSLLNLPFKASHISPATSLRVHGGLDLL